MSLFKKFVSHGLVLFFAGELKVYEFILVLPLYKALVGAVVSTSDALFGNKGDCYSTTFLSSAIELNLYMSAVLSIFSGVV